MSKWGKRFAWGAGLLLVLAGLGTTFVAYRISSRVLETPPSQAPNAPQDPRSTHGLAFEDVEFASSDGVTLRGWLVKPNGRARAGAVFAHGRSGSRRFGLWWLPAMHEAGFCSLLYDTRGAGSSDRGPTGGGFNGGHLDIIAAADLLEARCGVRAVATIGMSQGASNAIVAAAQSDRIAATVAIGAGPSLYDALRATPTLSGMPDWMIALVTRVCRLRMGKPWLDIAAGPIDHVHEVSPRALMLIHGSDDEAIPIGQAGRLHARARAPKHFWIIEGGRHTGLAELVGDELSRRVTAYLSDHLPR